MEDVCKQKPSKEANFKTVLSTVGDLPPALFPLKMRIYTQTCHETRHKGFSELQETVVNVL